MIPNHTPPIPAASETVAAQADPAPTGTIRPSRMVPPEPMHRYPGRRDRRGPSGRAGHCYGRRLCRLTITASLYKAHAPWLTEVYIDLDIAGLADNWSLVRGNATVPANRAGEIGQTLVDLAARGSIDQQREIDEHPARLRKVAA
jgi:hypothetical protein